MQQVRPLREAAAAAAGRGFLGDDPTVTDDAGGPFKVPPISLRLLTTTIIHVKLSLILNILNILEYIFIIEKYIQHARRK